jgi:hypothetical protein
MFHSPLLGTSAMPSVGSITVPRHTGTHVRKSQPARMAAAAAIWWK